MVDIINNEHIREFNENGAICLRGVFDKTWIRSVQDGITKNVKDPSPYSESLKGDGGDGAYFNDYCNWTKIPEFQTFACLSPAAEIAATLTQSSYAAFYHEHVLIKDPGTMKETPWHQDQAYYPIDGFKVCSIWMPVDEVPEETCVQFIAGSHKWDWYFPKKFATGLEYQVAGDLKADGKCYKSVPQITNEHNILKWSLKPGDCIVFHMRTLHGAPCNFTLDRPRRVLSTRWLGDDAVIATRPWELSPPTVGGLNPGDRAVSEEFPIVWRKEASKLP